ncbi:YwiC-like family protein [Arcanobacterium haemolyticum]|uniref:YwiC-like family protein n=1 Tax=Arcanobacterium haemolyticum TaxID=28264 RepID=UPI000DE5AE81
MVKRRGAQWVPNYHGAWAMVAIPPLLGVFESGFVWPHVVLLTLWWLGYFDFFAIGLWLRSGRKARFWPPVVAYTVPCVVLGVVLALWVPFCWCGLRFLRRLWGSRFGSLRCVRIVRC